MGFRDVQAQANAAIKAAMARRKQFDQNVASSTAAGYEIPTMPTFQYGGMNDTQKQYLELLKQGLERGRKKGVRNIAELSGASGVGGGQLTKQLGDIESEFAQKGATTEYGLRNQAEQDAFNRFQATQVPQWQALLGRNQASWQAGQNAYQAALDREQRTRDIRESKKKDFWDKIPIIGSIF